MGDPVLVAPSGGNSNTVAVDSDAMRKLRLVGKKLYETTSLSAKVDYQRYYHEANQVFASVRALRGLSDLLAAQPGYQPGEPAGEKRRSALQPVKQKVDALCSAIEQKCNPLNPLPVIAPKALEKRAEYAGVILAILNDTDNTQLIKTLRDDKSVPAIVKHEFLQALGFAMQAAMDEVLKTKREEEVYDAVEAALNKHDDKTMVGACFLAISAAAGSVGGLPGPDSFYIALLKIQSVRKLMTIAESTARVNAMFSEVYTHLTKALQLSVAEERAIQESLKNAKRNPDKAKVELNKAKEIIKNRCGQFQQTGVYNWSITVLNLLTLLNAWSGTSFSSWKSWSDVELQKVLDLGNAAFTTLSGLGAAAGKTLDIIKLTKVCEKLGNAVGYVAAFTAVVDGFCSLSEAWESGDAWKISGSGVQIASGLLLFAGVALSSPGLQLMGLIAGLVGGALQLTSDVIEALKDALKRVFMKLIKQLREVKSSWDGELIIEKLGVSKLVDDIEKSANDCDVGVILVDPRWQQAGIYDAVVSRVMQLGVDRTVASSMVRYAGLADSIGDFRAAEAQRPKPQ